MRAWATVSPTTENNCMNFFNQPTSAFAARLAKGGEITAKEQDRRAETMAKGMDD